jgi:ABC-2 type transport system ATP-binding protein
MTPLPVAPPGGVDTAALQEARQDELLGRGIVKHWGSNRVLDGVDIDIEPGQCVALEGSNGAGKTTLLRILAGLILPREGTVLLGDLSPERDRRAYQRRIGMVSAGDRGLYARLTTRQHLDFWARISFVPREQRRDRIERMIADFNLSALADHRVDRMSMGQRQRLRLALAFLHGPDILLLDEPRNSLDGEGYAGFAGALEQHARDGGMAVWCYPTGEPNEFSFARRFMLEQGSLVSL